CQPARLPLWLSVALIPPPREPVVDPDPLASRAPRDLGCWSEHETCGWRARHMPARGPLWARARGARTRTGRYSLGCRLLRTRAANVAARGHRIGADRVDPIRRHQGQIPLDDLGLGDLAAVGAGAKRAVGDAADVELFV